MRFKSTKISIFCVKVLAVSLISCASSICYSGSAETYIARAQKFQAEGNYVNAITEFYNAIIKEPSYPYTYNHLAVISNIVLDDYYAAAGLYEKALSLLEFRKAFLEKGLISTVPSGGSKSNSGDLFSVEKLEAVIKEIEEKKRILIRKVYNAIDSPIYPIYIAIKEKKKVYTSLFKGKPIPPDSLAGQKEFMFLELQNDWYKVQLPSSNVGWIKSNDINLIYRNKAEPIILSKVEKANVYNEFSIRFQNHVLAEKAKIISDKLVIETGVPIRTAKKPQSSSIAKSPQPAVNEPPHTNVAKNSQPPANKNLSPAEKEEQIMAKLKKLEDFFKKDLIDQEEYEAKKREILKEL
ncbi:MAG: hypothetical protein ACUZ8H_01160 [Candidatus Anammoxibacter sp.]